MIKVLIVDDEPLSRLALINMLSWEEHGYSVVGSAENGLRGVDLARVTLPDIIMVDIKMPVMDGLEMMRIITREQPNVKFIILTAYAEFKYAQEALKLGAVDYIIKLKLNAGLLLETLENIRGKLSVEQRGNSYYSREAHNGLIQRFLQPESKTDNPKNPLPPGQYRIGYIEVFNPITGLCLAEYNSTVGDIIDETFRRVDDISMEYASASPCLYLLLLRILKSGADSRIADLYALLRQALRRYLNMDMHFGLGEIFLPDNAPYSSSGGQIINAINFIRQNFNKPLQLSHVASQASMNPSYFCTVFKQFTGQSFINYLNNIRVERAQQLLMSGLYTVSDISTMVGYDSSAYFARVFKRATGVQPTAYRKTKMQL